VGDTDGRQIPALPAFDPGYLNLLFVGRHDRQKGLDVLLSAMAHLTAQKIRLHVAGAGIVGDDCKRENSDNIFWLGWLSGDELIAYYRACDAVVMPSRWEGMPLVALEAMREGKPVLAARREPLPEVVADGGILFEPENAAVLAAVLQKLDSSELVRLGHRARVRYESRFQSQRMGEELRRLYQELQVQAQKFN
jgi:glycosyltransferase involved in cell wall biosynthesis